MRLVVIGAGGHARVIIDALRAEGRHEPVACTDPRPALHGTTVEGVPVIGGDDLLGALDVEAAALGVGSVGDNALRAGLRALAADHGFAFPPVVHTRACVAPSATLGDGAAVLAGAVVGPGARIGAGAIVNTAAVVDHDCVVGDDAHIAPAAALAGAVRVGERAHVGLGARVLGGVAIGAEAIVGAGAVVLHDVAPGETVVGVPARALAREGR